MEWLFHCINYLVNNNIQKPIRLSKNDIAFSHFFFMDDLVTFWKANDDQTQTIKKALDDFCASSGYKVTASNALIFFSHNVNLGTTNYISNNFSFQISSNLGEYLGVHLLHDRVNKDIYNYIIEKINKKLSS